MNMAARSLPVLPEPAHVSTVGPGWLAERLARRDVRVLDVRSRAEVTRRTGRAASEYARGHVPGAVALDVRAALFDDGGEVVSAPELALAMSFLGVGDGDVVVLVDAGPTTAEARAAAWALARYGHADVHVLEGGHARWVAEGRPVRVGVERNPAASFTARVTTA